MTNFDHTPVLLDPVMEFIDPKSGGVYADVTLGGAGHARAILERSGPDGRLVGTDRDPTALEAGREALGDYADRAWVRKARISELPDVLRALQVDGVDGLVADLGVSSVQFDRAERGFSLAQDGPIDMRMDPTEGDTALDLIASSSAEELADVIYQYGEERRSRRVARALRQAYEEGALRTTGDLRRTVHRATGPKRGRIDPATRTFQALRIAVNEELAELESLLEYLPSVLREGGVAAVISFHSLEDRLVKHAFRDNPALEPLTKRPVVADDDERARNPRSRSAKLRAARHVEAAA
ncbi:MAG: 16S rRNA (cytosine(1402)-N(4))-methyltransferase RsmH [Myxococcota bacterium]